MVGPESEPTTSAAPQSGVLSGPGVAGRVVTGGLQRVGGFAVLNVITALAAVLLLRYLGVDDFGRYGTVMALMTIVQGVSDGGLTLTGSRELSLRTGADDRRELLGHLVALRILFTGTGVGLAVAFAIAVGYSTTLVEGTALVGASTLLLSIQSAILLPLTVGLENYRLAINDVLRQLVLVVCFVALAVVGATLVAFFAASLVAAVVVLLLTPRLMHGKPVARPRWSRSAIRALVVSTLPLAVFGVLSVLYFRVLVILMSLLQTNATQLGYYVTSARVIEIFLNLPLLLIGVVLPVLSVSARDNASRLQYVTLRLTQVMAWLGALLAMILGIGARPILLILGGSRYLGASAVLQIQCLALITIFVTGAWTTSLVSLRHTRELAIATLIGLVALGSSGTILIDAMGARGAAIAAVVADVLYCAAVFIYARRSGATRAMQIRPFARIALCALPGLVIAVASPLSAAVNCVVATVFFLGLTVPTRALPPEVIERAPGLRRRGPASVVPPP